MRSTLPWLALALILPAPLVHAGPVTLFTTRQAFDQATTAQVLPIPPWQSVFCTSCDQPGTGSGASLTWPFGAGNALTMTGSLCLFDAGVLIYPYGNTIPDLMITNTLVMTGEDDYPFAFAEPVLALGLGLLTNRWANEQIYFYDAGGNLLDSLNLDPFTDPNVRLFLGFQSSVPFSYVFLDTTLGGAQNEGIELIEVGGQSVPDPGSTLLLLGTALAGLGAVRRRWW